MHSVPKFQSFSVDSKYITYSMARNTSEETKTLEELSGAYALSWFNAEDNSFNLARNMERPLSYAWDKRGNFYYSSDEDILRVGLLAGNLTGLEIFELPVGEQWKFQRSKEGLQVNTINFTPKPDTRWQQGTYSGYGGKYSNYSATAAPKIRFTVQDIQRMDANTYRAFGTEVETGTAVQVPRLSHATYSEMMAEIKKNPDVIYVGGWSYNHSERGVIQWKVVSNLSVIKEEPSHKKTKGKSHKTSQDISVVGPFGVLISIDEALKFSGGSCIICNSTLLRSDFTNDLIEWTNNGGAVCPECINTWSE